jgi:hypothetical protein
MAHGLHPSHHGVTDFLWRTALGLLDETTANHKFGRNPVVDTVEEDVWDVGGDETLLTAAATMYASCEATGQTQTIMVEGLDENWLLQAETVVLNGQTPVIIGAADSWTRIDRAYQVSAGPPPTDDVWIAELDTVTLGVPQTATKIHGFIDFTADGSQTQKCMFTVPAGKLALVHNVHVDISAAQGTSRSLSAGLHAQSLAAGATLESPSWAPRRRVLELSALSDGNSEDQRHFGAPLVFPALTNLSVRASCSAASAVIGQIDYILAPE